MATTVATPEQAGTVGAVTSEKQTYRTYVLTAVGEDGKTVIKETRILAEADKKAPEKDKNGAPNPYAGLAINWAKAEEDGLTLFSENEVIRYNIKSLDGAEFLSPDPAIRLYIYQVGLASVQTARANALMKAQKEGTADPEPEFNQVTVDLRTGTDDEGSYSLNRAPSRKSVSEIEKFTRQANSLLAAMGIPEEERAAKIAAMVASLQATTEE